MPTDDENGPENADERSSPQGRMRFQDENTTPREPTLAEKKAREQAERRAREAQQAEDEAKEKSRKKRKRILIGAGATVGVVALVAVGYQIAKPDQEVDAQCVDEESGVVVDDANCVTPAAASSSGGYYHSGGGFYPIFIGTGGRQYRYNYGGTGAIGQPVSGGTSTVPTDGTKVRTSSGSVFTSSKSSSTGKSSASSGSSGSGPVSRGGLGTSSGGSSSKAGGGSSGS